MAPVLELLGMWSTTPVWPRVLVHVRSYLWVKYNYLIFYYSWNYLTIYSCVMVKAMDCGIVVREFVLQSCYHVHFRANTLGKGMNPFSFSLSCSSRRIALALNNLNVDMPLNKETKETKPRPHPDPVCWGCRIHWLHLCRGVRLHKGVSWIRH